MAPIFYAQFTHNLQKTHKIPAHTRREANAETRIKPGFFEFQKRPEKGVKSATNQKVGGSSPSWRATKLRLDAIRVPGAAFSFTQRHALLPCASFAPAKLGRANRATRDLTRSLRLATNFLRIRARALFLSGLQFPYKIPAGEAQRDFPVQSGHGFSCPIRPRTKMPGCCRIRAFLFQQSGPGDRSPCFSARTSSRVQGWVL